jgi:hypothetical protein
MTNIDERIKQCEADIESLEAEKQQLLEEKKKEAIFEPGDIVIFSGFERFIVRIGGIKYAVDKNGVEWSRETNLIWKSYKKIGTCGGFIAALPGPALR